MLEEIRDAIDNNVVRSVSTQVPLRAMLEVLLVETLQLIEAVELCATFAIARISEKSRSREEPRQGRWCAAHRRAASESWHGTRAKRRPVERAEPTAHHAASDDRGGEAMGRLVYGFSPEAGILVVGV